MIAISYPYGIFGIQWCTHLLNLVALKFRSMLGSFSLGSVREVQRARNLPPFILGSVWLARTLINIYRKYNIAYVDHK
jgi:hypothetical protein